MENFGNTLDERDSCSYNDPFDNIPFQSHVIQARVETFSFFSQFSKQIFKQFLYIIAASGYFYYSK